MTTQEEQYIIDESQEISIGEAEGWTEKIFLAFPALKNKKYRLYFFGQLISLIGTWLQMVAQGWLVFELTHSAFAVGLVAALGSLPILVFALFGGILVDRYSKKKLLLITQSVEMVLAGTLAYLTLTGMITVVDIAVLSMLLGFVTALDMPARQAFTAEIVDTNDLSSAIALNSATFNGARVVGPAIAGILISQFGAGFAFLINAISFMAVLTALNFMKVQAELPKTHPHPFKAIKEGFAYVRSHSIIKTTLFFAGIASVFGWSHSILMPVIIQNVFHENAQTLGYFFAAQGVGALGAAIVASHYSKKFSPVYLVLIGSFIFCVSIILFAFSTSLLLAYLFLFASGFGLIMTFSMITATLQHLVEDHLRGRIMSMFTVMFLGTQPIGNFLMGFIAEKSSPQAALILGGVVMGMWTLYLFLQRMKLNEQYYHHVEAKA